MTEAEYSEIESALSYIRGLASTFYTPYDAEDIISYVKEYLLTHWKPERASAKTFSVQMYQQGRLWLKQQQLGLAMSLGTMHGRIHSNRAGEIDECNATSLQSSLRDDNGDKQEVGDFEFDVNALFTNEQAELDDYIELVKKLLLKLSQREQAILNLHVIQKMPLHTVGKMTALSYQQVKNISDGAIKKLKKMIERRETANLKSGRI